MIIALPRLFFDLQSGLVSRLEAQIFCFEKNFFWNVSFAEALCFIHQFTLKSCFVCAWHPYFGPQGNVLRAHIHIHIHMLISARVWRDKHIAMPAQSRHPRHFFYLDQIQPAQAVTARSSSPVSGDANTTGWDSIQVISTLASSQGISTSSPGAQNGTCLA